MIFIKLIGVFYALEGAANVIYFIKFHKDDASRPLFQLGRIARTLLGIALIIFG